MSLKRVASLLFLFTVYWCELVSSQEHFFSRDIDCDSWLIDSIAPPPPLVITCHLYDYLKNELICS
jgi:hypothetical protein